MITINGIAIKNPKIEYGEHRLSKSGRTASGRMTMEIIAIKHRIDLSWEAISGTEWKAIKDLLRSATFYQVRYPAEGDSTEFITETMYVGDITSKLHTRGGRRVFVDASFPLIEQ